MDSFKVFVYGTLKPGESNYRRYCQGRVAESWEAIAHGQLFALPIGYPAMTEGSGIVHGVVLFFKDPKVLPELDLLENFHPQRPPEQNEYQRLPIQTFNMDRQPLATVWAYIMLPEKVRSYGVDTLRAEAAQILKQPRNELLKALSKHLYLVGLSQTQAFQLLSSKCLPHRCNRH